MFQKKCKMLFYLLNELLIFFLFFFSRCCTHLVCNILLCTDNKRKKDWKIASLVFSQLYSSVSYSLQPLWSLAAFQQPLFQSRNNLSNIWKMYSCIELDVQRNWCSSRSLVEELKRVLLRETAAFINNTSLLKTASFIRTLCLGLL